MSVTYEPWKPLPRSGIRCDSCGLSFPEDAILEHLEEFHVGPKRVDEDIRIQCGVCPLSLPLGNKALLYFMRHCATTHHPAKDVHINWKTYLETETTRLLQILMLGEEIERTRRETNQSGSAPASDGFRQILMPEIAKRKRITRKSLEVRPPKSKRLGRKKKRAPELPETEVTPTLAREIKNETIDVEVDVVNQSDVLMDEEHLPIFQPAPKEQNSAINSDPQDFNDSHESSQEEVEEDGNVTVTNMDEDPIEPSVQESGTKQSTSKDRLRVPTPGPRTGTSNTENVCYDDSLHLLDETDNHEPDTKSLPQRGKQLSEFRTPSTSILDDARKKRKKKKRKIPKEPKRNDSLTSERSYTVGAGTKENNDELNTNTPSKQEKSSCHPESSPAIDESWINESINLSKTLNQTAQAEVDKEIEDQPSESPPVDKTPKLTSDALRYFCQLCDYFVVKKDRLRRQKMQYHVFRHNHNFLPLKCQSCSYRSCTKSMIVKHSLRLNSACNGEFENIQTDEMIEDTRRLIAQIFPDVDWDTYTPRGKCVQDIKW